MIVILVLLIIDLVSCIGIGLFVIDATHKKNKEFRERVTWLERELDANGVKYTRVYDVDELSDAYIKGGKR